MPGKLFVLKQANGTSHRSQNRWLRLIGKSKHHKPGMLGWRIGKDVSKPYIKSHESAFFAYTDTYKLLIRAATQPLTGRRLNVMPCVPEKAGRLLGHVFIQLEFQWFKPAKPLLAPVPAQPRKRGRPGSPHV
jgi:hypothetical protein